MTRTLNLRTPTEEERREVERPAHAQSAPARLIERARVVMAAPAGERTEVIASRFQVTAATVYLWLRRFNDHGIAGLEDRPRQDGHQPTRASSWPIHAGSSSSSPNTPPT